MQEEIGVSHRGRGRIIANVRMIHFYRYWIKGSKENKQTSFTTYSSIVTEYLSKIMFNVIRYNYEFKLPYRLGYIAVVKFKPKNNYTEDGMLDTSKMKADYVKTKELWKRDPEAYRVKKKLYHLNEHTDGFYFRVMWDKRASNIRNKSAYTFEPVRKYKREIAVVMNDENKKSDYFRKCRKAI